jgi:hypothetical protein
MPPTLLHSYTGPFTQDAVVATGQKLRAVAGLSENARHRLFATFVELAQNIGRYSAERAGLPGAERGVGLVEIRESEEHLRIEAANPVTPETAAALAAALAAIAPLDADALKELHRERRRGAPPPGSLGAGLGLIELARHAAAPLAHTAVPRPDGLVLFTLSVPLARA